MKIKSIVLTAALATAFSAFSDSVDIGWFSTSPADVRYFDTEIDSPVTVDNSFSVPTGWTIASYAITAHVTNLVVFAEVPSTTPTTISDISETKYARGAICAANDKWYGLKYTENNPSWEALSDTVAPQEGHSYKFRMDFANNGNTVTYSVNDLADNSVAVSGQQLTTKVTTTSDALPNLYAFAGMGGCTNIVGEIVVAVTPTSVEGGGPILVPTYGEAYADARTNSVATAANGLKNWVNYVLGIDEPTATSKPYAAPVQNSDTDKLTFRLAGIGTVRGQDTTGAKVTYTVEELVSPNAASGNPTKLDNNPNGYVGPNDPISVDLPSSGVKYYRIKIKIDPAH